MQRAFSFAVVETCFVNWPVHCVVKEHRGEVERQDHRIELFSLRGAPPADDICLQMMATTIRHLKARDLGTSKDGIIDLNLIIRSTR